ncbi:RHS repeat-associated core domain-containing protein, partial [Pseudomonas fontis]
MRSPQGHSVTLHYEPFNVTSPLLSQILAADGFTQLLSVKRNNGVLKLTLLPDSPAQASFTLSILNGVTSSIVLPTDDQASWRFEYLTKEGMTCLSTVRSPTGSREVITYDTSHRFPSSRPGAQGLPRVASHTLHPGFDQPPLQTRYKYDNTERNFLGHGSGLVWSDDGLDNLYQITNDYTYETTEMLWDPLFEQAKRTTRRVYNRFHLMVLEELSQRDPDPEKGYARLETCTTYHLEKGLTFKDQPPYCQLPATITQTWYYSEVVAPQHQQTTTILYDVFGNLVKKVNANGVVETQEWYSAAGEGGACPADPEGFVRSLKRKTVFPAAATIGEQAPVLQSDYRYAAQQGLGGVGTWLALQDETLNQLLENGTRMELSRETHQYFDTPQDPLCHGMLHRIEKSFHGDASTRNSTELSYQIKTNDRVHLNTKVLQTLSTLTGNDGSCKTTIQENELLTGRSVFNDDGDGNVMLITYDRMGRVTRETVAPDTPYEARKTYEYWLTNGLQGQQAMQQITDVNGVQTRTWMDGLNRIISVERQDADALGGSVNAFRKTSLATYNSFGQLAAHTDIDWDGGQDIPLTSTFAYDTWGEQCKTIGPDGVAQLSVKDPTRLTECSWTESADTPARVVGMSRTTFNLFDKEDKIEQLDAQGKTVATRVLRYDGLGNCVEQMDEQGNVTRFKFDPFSRLHRSTLPNGEVVSLTYATHSSDALPIAVSAGLSEQDQHEIGTQAFDGLWRRTQVTSGKRLQQFEYHGGQPHVRKLTTASGKEITYEYTLGLVDTPVGSQAPDEQSSFNYDAANALLKVSNNTQGHHAFEYNKSGQLVSERWQDAAVATHWQTTYTQTLAGRPLTRLDSNGLLITYRYDELARVKSMTQGLLVAAFEYDSFGRTNVMTTCNQHTNISLRTALEFDDHGREIQRTQTLLRTALGFDDHGREIQRTQALSGQPEHSISQTWREDGKLASRHLQVAGSTALLECFVYDARGRLEAYTCEGSERPKDRYGNAIAQQMFTFDVLDNITYMYTEFADNSTDDAFFSYAVYDPCQLVNVTHNHPTYPAQVELEYDSDGNLRKDEHGQRLHYDSQSRLLKVTDAAGKIVSSYRYDAHNHLLGVKHGQDKEALRFYQGDRLSRIEQGNDKTHFLYHGSQPLGQQTQGDADKTLLLITDSKNSVLAESSENTLRRAVHGAYGEQALGEALSCPLGFNGEVRDELSGWYLLGRGYRAYNPSLMRFHSPDSLSPFGAGGLNPYMYCLGDPINFVDPTGHRAESAMYGRKEPNRVWSIIALTIAAVLTAAAAIAFPPTGFASGALFVGFGAFDVVGIARTSMDIHRAKHADTMAERLEAGRRSSTDSYMTLGFSLLPFVPSVFRAAKGAVGNFGGVRNF